MREIDKCLEQFRKHWEDRFNQFNELFIHLKSKENEK